MAATALAFVGGQLGGTVGYAVGALLGNVLFPQQFPDHQGPRLTDLKTTSSTFGQYINQCYGTMRLGGNIIWSSDLIETRSEQTAGKGGPSQTQITYTYSASFAVAICEGEITGVNKIYADTRLIYDVNDSATLDELIASGELDLVIYTGTETQLPDATIESYEGTDNVPAFRGLAYIVFTDMQLAKFGNRIPMITAEVISNGSINGFSLFATNLLEDFTSDIQWQISEVELIDGFIGMHVPEPYVMWSGRRTINSRKMTFDIEGNIVTDVLDGRTNYNHRHIRNIFNHEVSFMIGYLGNRYQIENYYSNVYVYTAPASDGGDLIRRLTPDDVVTTTDTAIGSCLTSNKEYLFLIARDSSSNYYYRVLDSNLTSIRDGQIPDMFGSTFPYTPGLGSTQFFVSDDLSTLWLYRNSTGSLRVFDYNEITGEYDQSGSLSITGSNTASIVGNNEFLWVFDMGVGERLRIFKKVDTLTNDTVLLSNVITDICNKVGLSASDIDVTNITQTLNGYAISNQSTARSLLQQLAIGYYFDTVESDFKIKFIERVA